MTRSLLLVCAISVTAAAGPQTFDGPSGVHIKAHDVTLAELAPSLAGFSVEGVVVDDRKHTIVVHINYSSPGGAEDVDITFVNVTEYNLVLTSLVSTMGSMAVTAPDKLSAKDFAELRDAIHLRALSNHGNEASIPDDERLDPKDKGARYFQFRKQTVFTDVLGKGMGWIMADSIKLHVLAT